MMQRARVITRPPNLSKKMGVVVIDMQDMRSADGRPMFSYDYGTVPEGIAKLCRVLECAKSLDIPIILVKLGMVTFRFEESRPRTDFVTPEILPEVAECLDGYQRTRIVGKTKSDAYTNPEFRATLEELGIDTLIFTGYNKAECVWRTAVNAALSGLIVVTGAELLFGSINDHKHEMEIQRAMEFYRTNTVWVENVEKVISFMRQNSGEQYG